MDLRQRTRACRTLVRIRRPLFVALALALVSTGSGAEGRPPALSVLDRRIQRRITYTLHGAGSLSRAYLSISASRDVTLVVPAGVLLRWSRHLDGTAADDKSWPQDLLVTEKLLVTLQRGETKELMLHVACANSSRRTPSTTDEYRFQRAPERLQKLAACLEKRKMHRSAWQQLVWAARNGVQPRRRPIPDEDPGARERLLALLDRMRGECLEMETEPQRRACLDRLRRFGRATIPIPSPSVAKILRECGVPAPSGRIPAR